MCSACNIKVGKVTDADDTRQNFFLADAFAKNDVEAMFDFSYCTSPEKFKNAFKSLGLEINSSEHIKTLVLAHEQGWDVKEFKVDFKELVFHIPLTHEERQNTACKTMLIKS